MSQQDRFLLAGVMGFPVMHSRSPRLHNYWFQHYGLQGTYVPLAVQPDGLVAALKALPALGFAGCNVTIPHKETALAALAQGVPLEAEDLAAHLRVQPAAPHQFHPAKLHQSFVTPSTVAS